MRIRRLSHCIQDSRSLPLFRSELQPEKRLTDKHRKFRVAQAPISNGSTVPLSYSACLPSCRASDAGRVRAQIILLGQAVTVESGTVKDATWYRVLVGPFSNREQLTVAQKQLAGAGFSNLLLQQRQSR